MKWYHKKPSAISCVWYGKVLSDSFSARGVVSFTRSAGAGMGSRMVVVEVEHAVKEGMRDGGVKMRCAQATEVYSWLLKAATGDAAEPATFESCGCLK